MLEKFFELLTNAVTQHPEHLVPVVFVLLMGLCLVVIYLFARVTTMCNTQRANFPVILQRLDTLDKQINHANEGEDTLRARVFKDAQRLARVEGLLLGIDRQVKLFRTDDMNEDREIP